MKNILIADDAIFMRTILRGVMERAGYAVVAEASDAESTYEKYKELYGTKNKVDAILLDVTMPGMPSAEALTSIMEFDKDANVIILSSLTSYHTITEMVKRGAKNFIQKPFIEENVIGIIEKVLEASDRKKETKKTPSKTEELRELILSGYIKKVKLGKL